MISWAPGHDAALLGYEQNYRIKKVRGPAFTVFGSFLIAYSTSLLLYYNFRLEYIILGASSCAVMVLIDMGFRMRKTSLNILSLMGAGTLLAVEGTMLLAYFQSLVSLTYSSIVIAGAFFLLKGVHDVGQVRSTMSREGPAASTGS